MKKQTFSVLVLATLLVVAVSSCGDGTGKKPPPPTESRPTQEVHDANAENPDRDSWVDLSKEPFHPEWVGGSLVVARPGIMNSLNNLVMPNAGDGGAVMRYFLCPRLVRVSPDLVENGYEVVPWAAAALPERAADGVTYTWRLRQDLVWEGGVAVTSKDYVFTWKMLGDPNVDAGARRGELEMVKDVRATGKFTIEVVFKEPYYNAAAEFGLHFTIVPEHAMPREAEAFNTTRQHLSYGAYRVKAYDTNHLLLELRPEYRKARFPIHTSYVELVEYRKVTDRAAILAQLRRGDVSIAGVSHDQYDSLDQDAEFKKSCWKTWYYLPGYTFVCWNLWASGDQELHDPHPVLGDAQVRTALGHLFPRKRLIDELCHGRAHVADGPFFFTDPHRDPTLEPLTHDLEAAGRILDQAGWKMNSRGLREKDGVMLSIDLRFPQDSRIFDVPVNRFQSSARKVGVQVNLQPSAFRPLLAAIRSRSFDAFCVRTSINPPVEPDIYAQWHSRAAGGNGKNYPGLRDAEVDRLIMGYRSEFDASRRMTMRRALHRRLHELQPYAFLISQASTVAVNRKWANVKIHDMGPRYSDFVLRRLWK